MCYFTNGCFSWRRWQIWSSVHARRFMWQRGFGFSKSQYIVKSMPFIFAVWNAERQSKSWYRIVVNFAYTQHSFSTPAQPPQTATGISSRIYYHRQFPFMIDSPVINAIYVVLSPKSPTWASNLCHNTDPTIRKTFDLHIAQIQSIRSPIIFPHLRITERLTHRPIAHAHIETLLKVVFPSIWRATININRLFKDRIVRIVSRTINLCQGACSKASTSACHPRRIRRTRPRRACRDCRSSLSSVRATKGFSSRDAISKSAETIVGGTSTLIEMNEVGSWCCDGPGCGSWIGRHCYCESESEERRESRELHCDYSRYRWTEKK